MYWPAWACSSVPSLDRVLNTRPRYQGVEIVTSFFKSHQRTLLPRKRCGCGITEMESKRQNFSKRELPQPFIYAYGVMACSWLRLERLEMRGKCRQADWQADWQAVIGMTDKHLRHCNTRHVSSLFITENTFKHDTRSTLASVNYSLINETLVELLLTNKGQNSRATFCRFFIKNCTPGRSLSPWLQSFPPYPKGQSQKKVFQPTLHVPPFWQGLDLQKGSLALQPVVKYKPKCTSNKG